jgi:hypothetical protein
MKDRSVGKDDRKVFANGFHSHDGGHTWHLTACQKTAEIEARAGTAFSVSPVRQKMAGRDRPHRPH